MPTAEPAIPVEPVPASVAAAAARALVAEAIEAVSRVLRGHPDVVRTVFAAVLARGHVLLEDVPGVGKTTLARAVARALGTTFARIQFTADMLPTDVLGVQVLTPEGTLSFRPGPIFSQVVLADEINRASPKTQSAMLEAMAEGSVTIDDATHILPAPFLVIATQNPVEHHGAYPLPESQLDRFLVSLSVGYPDAADERALLLAPQAPQQQLQSMPQVLNPERVRSVQSHVDAVRLSADVADYILAIVAHTREHPDILLGCSPRGAVGFGTLARAWAFLSDRDFVVPDDVKAVAVEVLAHRLVLGTQGGLAGRAQARQLVESIVAAVPPPR